MPVLASCGNNNGDTQGHRNQRTGNFKWSLAGFILINDGINSGIEIGDL